MAFNSFTGKRATHKWIIWGVIIGVAVLAGLTFWLRVLQPMLAKRAQAKASIGNADFHQLTKEITEGKTPDQQQHEKERATYLDSLQMNRSELAQRAAEQREKDRQRQLQNPNSPAALDAQARKAAAEQPGNPQNRIRPTSVGSITLLEDLKAMQTQQSTGVASDLVTKPQGASAPGGAPVASAEQEEAPYIPVYTREIAAAERVSAEMGGKSSSSAQTQAEKVPEWQQFDAPVTPDAQADNSPRSGDTSGVAADAGEKGRIPVNVIPPYTVPIPAVFANNFIAVGPGTDTAQVVIASVESDVYHNNRLQLGRGARFIGTSGGVRDLDMVDVTFHTLQFADGTQIKVSAQAYAAYDKSAPDSFGIRGVVGDYEEPPAWSQLMPLLLTGLQGYSQSNFDKLAKSGLRTDTTTGTVSVETTDRDRVFSAASAVSDKLLANVMETLKRYRPRVRIHHGSPLIIISSEYIDISKRDFMGFTNPMAAPRKAKAASPVSALETPTELQTPKNTAATLLQSPDKVREAIAGLNPDQLKQLMALVNNPQAATQDGKGSQK